MEPLVIVGTGLAGYTLARAFRKLDAETPLHLVTADDGIFYSKPMLSNALAKGKSPAQLAQADGEKMARELNATLWTHTRATGLDTAAHVLHTDRGELPYGRLVLAVGATPIRPPLAGDGAEAVLSINGLDDYARYHAALEGVERVAVLGPGLIGCEFANDLAQSGRKVTIVGPDTQPLGRLLPEAAGSALQAALTDIGISWHLGTVAESVERNGKGFTITLADGATVAADLVVSAVGLRPDLRLGESAGLRVNRGIVVNAELRSSDPNVFALGDCAEVDGQVLPFVMPLMEQAKVLAAVLAGHPARLAYPVMPVVVKTPAHPVVVVPPAPGSAGVWEVEVREDGVRAEFRDGQQLRGFALTGAAVSAKQVLVQMLSERAAAA